MVFICDVYKENMGIFVCLDYDKIIEKEKVMQVIAESISATAKEDVIIYGMYGIPS